MKFEDHCWRLTCWLAAVSAVLWIAGSSHAHGPAFRALVVVLIVLALLQAAVITVQAVQATVARWMRHSHDC